MSLTRVICSSFTETLNNSCTNFDLTSVNALTELGPLAAPKNGAMLPIRGKWEKCSLCALKSYSETLRVYYLAEKSEHCA